MYTACQSSVRRKPGGRRRTHTTAKRQGMGCCFVPTVVLTSPVPPPIALSPLPRPLRRAEGCRGLPLLTVHPLPTCLPLPITPLAIMLQEAGSPGSLTFSTDGRSGSQWEEILTITALRRWRERPLRGGAVGCEARRWIRSGVVPGWDVMEAGHPSLGDPEPGGL